MMTAIHEVQQVLTCDTPFGEAQALFIIDYGVHRNTIWVCANFDDGKIRHFDTSQISITRNHTLDFNIGKNCEADASHQINDKKVAPKNDWKDFYDEDYMNRIGEQFGNWWEKI